MFDSTKINTFIFFFCHFFVDGALCDVNWCLVVGSIFSTRWCSVMNLCALRPYVHHGRWFRLWAQTLWLLVHAAGICALSFSPGASAAHGGTEPQNHSLHTTGQGKAWKTTCAICDQKNIAKAFWFLADCEWDHGIGSGPIRSV